MDQENQRDGGERAEDEMQGNREKTNQAAGGTNSKELGKRKAAQNMYYREGSFSSDDEDWETSRDDLGGDPSFRLGNKETRAKIAKKKKAKKSKVVVPSNHPVLNRDAVAGASSSNVERDKAHDVKLQEREESVEDNEDRNNMETDTVASYSDEETFGDLDTDTGNSSSDWENVETRAAKLSASSQNDHEDQNNLGIYASASHSEKTMAIKRTTVPYYHQNTRGTRFPKTPYALKSATLSQARQEFKYPVHTVHEHRHGPGSLAGLKQQNMIVKEPVPLQRGVPYFPMRFGRPRSRKPVVRTDLGVKTYLVAETLLDVMEIPLVRKESNDRPKDTALDVFGFNPDQIMQSCYPLPNDLKFPEGQEKNLEEIYFSHKMPEESSIEILSKRIGLDREKVMIWFIQRQELDTAAGVKCRAAKTPEFVVRMEKAALFYGTAIFNGSIRRKVVEWALAGTKWSINELVANSILHHFVFRKSPYAVSAQGILDIHHSFRSLPAELSGKPAYLFLEHQFIHMYLWDESILLNAANEAGIEPLEALNWFRKRRLLAEERGDADFPYKPFGPWDERFAVGAEEPEAIGLEAGM